MHKTPAQIARSLRAFKNAHKIGLLRSVRIEPGRKSCEVTRSQRGTEYVGDTVPRLPLPQCTNGQCECKYVPKGSEKLHQLNIIGKSIQKMPS